MKKTLFKIEVWLNEDGQWCSQYELPPIDCDETLSAYTRFLEEFTRVIAYVPGSDTLVRTVKYVIDQKKNAEETLIVDETKDSCDGCDTCKHK